MSIYGALSSAVTGLKAQSFALANISGNIANSQTTAFKRTETSFTDLIPDNLPARQTSGSVLANSRQTNTVHGDILPQSVETYMAINGDGYFVISEQVAQVDGRPVFSPDEFYTRRGDFEIDKNGYLVNGAGYFLKGFPIDIETGNVTGSVPEVIQLTNQTLPARETTTITYRANLPNYPITADTDFDVPGSNLINAAAYTTDPTTAFAGPGDPTVNGADTDLFIRQSIAGGAITVYDEQGSPVNVQLRWAKVESLENGDAADVWNLFYLSDNNAGAADPAWTNIGQDYTFGANGQLNPALPNVTITGLTVNGINYGDLNLDHGQNTLTQFADPNGATRLTALSQDGYPAGEVVRVNINENGRFVAFYSNGQSAEIAQIATVFFNADNALKRLDGGAFAATFESGPAIPGAPGSIVGAALEGSNTDIADEFTKLIVTQQAYSANTRIVTTSTEMLREALNMVR